MFFMENFDFSLYCPPSLKIMEEWHAPVTPVAHALPAFGHKIKFDGVTGMRRRLVLRGSLGSLRWVGRVAGEEGAEK